MQEAQYIEITECGDKFYYKDKAMNIFHRIDGPAVEYADGDKVWWVDGKLHRVDNPAVEFADGYKAWYIDGKRHRIDGPAVEYASGYKLWYINGECLTEDEWKQQTTVTETILTLEDIAAKFGVDVKTLKITKEH